MISFLHGKLFKKSPTEIVVDVNGVGYAVNISVTTYESLGNESSDVMLFTHHVVREDAQLLFGFSSESEREMFRLLINVNGIGPKMAQSILSGMNNDELRQAIFSENISALTRISGVGKKTAERLIVELRDKLGKMETTFSSYPQSSGTNQLRSEAIMALTSLGFARNNAEEIVRAVIQSANGETISVEEIIKRALRQTAK